MQAIKMPGSDNHKFHTVLNKKLYGGVYHAGNKEWSLHWN